MQWSTSYFFPAIAMASHKKGVASLMYVTDAKDKAVFYWWKTESFCNQHRAQPHRPHSARLRGQVVLRRISHAERTGDTLQPQRRLGQGQRMGKPSADARNC